MILLLDTHVVVWLTIASGRLSKPAAQAIERARRSGSGLAISSMTLVEAAQQIVKQRIKLDASVGAFLHDLEARFSVLQISADVAERAVLLPANFPNDPADRIIAATAIVEGIPLVTADVRIQDAGVVKTIW